MIRTTMDLAYIKRPLRILYGWTQTTPSMGYLDPAWDRSTPLFPGNVMMRTTGDNFLPIDATGTPYGLLGEFIGGHAVDELLLAGVNALNVWVLGTDAQFEVDSDAFDTGTAFTDPGDGTEALVYAHTGAGGSVRGQLCASAAANKTAKPVARLVKVNSASTITIGGLSLPAAY